MANKVSFIIQLKNKFSKNSQRIRNDFDGITKRSDKARRAIKKFAAQTGNSFRKAKLSLSKFAKGIKAVAVGLAALAAAIAVTKVGAAFQDSILDLRAITGAAGEDLKFLTKRIRETSIEFGALPTDVAAMTKMIASAKPELLKNAKALAAMTSEALLLKTAAGIDATAAVDTLARGLNIFGKGADEASRFVDILAAGAKFGSSEIGATGEAMLIAGGAAVDAGINFRELNSAIQVVAKGGFTGAQAGTALQQIFIRLTKQGFDFKKLGVDGVMAQVAEKLDLVKGFAEKAQLKSKLFGEEHQKVAGALLREIPLITELNKKLKTQGIAAEQAKIKMSGVNFQLSQAKSRLAVLASKIFDRALPGIKLLGSTFNSFLMSLDAADIETFGIALSALATVFSGLAKAISFAFTAVMLVIKPVFALLKGIGTLIGQIVGAISTLDFSQFNLRGALDLGGRFLGLGGATAPKQVQAPSSPSISNNGTLSGEILVSAAKGSKVERTSLSTSGNGFNLGMNVPAGAN